MPALTRAPTWAHPLRHPEAGAILLSLQHRAQNLVFTGPLLRYSVMAVPPRLPRPPQPPAVLGEGRRQKGASGAQAPESCETMWQERCWPQDTGLAERTEGS